MRVGLWLLIAERSCRLAAAINVVIHALELCPYVSGAETRLYPCMHAYDPTSKPAYTEVGVQPTSKPLDVMPNPVRLALLICDTPTSTVASTYGSYLDIFRTFLDDSLALAGDSKPSFTLSGYDVVQGDFPTPEDLSHTDGILISGSSLSL